MSIENTNAQFPEKIDKKPLYSLQYAHIQEKIRKTYANALTDQTIPTGIVKVENIMSKLYEYTYKLCEYLLIIKIALEQPKLVGNSNIMYIAQSITHYATFIFDRDELANYIHMMLHRVTPTINKNYSRHIADFLLNHTSVTPAYHAYHDHIIAILPSILAYAHATINAIDSKYHRIDEVFFTEDQLEWLRNKAYNAFAKANNANKKVQHIWASICKHPFSLQALEQAFDCTIEARDAAQNARKAYRDFAEYFDQFTPTIQTMLNGCNAFVHTAQPAENSYTSYLRTALNTIRMIQSDIQQALDKLSEIIWRSHQAANQYNNSYDQYNRFINDMKYAICVSYNTGRYLRKTIQMHHLTHWPCLNE
ncbi:MAG: hypothetical protein NMK33_04395 [Candidatus Cardinium sp.]|nr:MAG: hypothetical protein NMK33_04395 [Candidatus Cardinium sp.]